MSDQERAAGCTTGTAYPELFAALAATFDPKEVKSRSQAGRTFQYVTARVVMNRLDDVLGPENWFDEFLPGEHSVLCRLTIRLPDGSLLTKCDAGGYAGMPDQGDDDKSGFSDSFKRAAVKFGVARYLYRDGVPHFGEVADDRPATAPQQPQRSRPADGLPSQGHTPYSSEQRQNGHADHPRPAPSGQNGAAPRSGRALFAWVKDQEQRHEVGLLKYLNQWASLNEMPKRMVDFNEDEVKLAHEEAVRKLQSLSTWKEGE